MIHCFFDDSGKESDQGNPYVCIAGYMAIGDGYWTLLSNAWGHQLFRHGISWLHMKDLMQDQDEYAALNWDWPKKQSVLEDFIKIIKGSQIIGFGVAVDAVAWRQFPKELTKVEGTAQEFCFMRIMRMITERLKLVRPDDWAVLYYDCDEGFTPARFQRFIGLRKRNPEVKQYFRGFSIADPKSFLPLQAADLLAWQTRKDLMRKLGGHESRPEYKFFFEPTTPFDTLDYVSELWTGPELEENILKPWLAAQQTGKEWKANEQMKDQILIRFTSNDRATDESDLKQYLETELGVRLRVELVEGELWDKVGLYLAAASVAKYAGQKLIDVLTDLLRGWLLRKPEVHEVLLYDSDGNVIKTVTRK